MRRRLVLAAGIVLLAVGSAGTATAEIEKSRDDLGRVVFAKKSEPSSSPDRDLLPPSTEALVERLRRLPANWTASTDVPFADLIQENALRYGVDPGLVEAVMATESAFNPFAISRAGAIGLMQLMPATARRFEVEDIFAPAQNVRAGTHYLSYLLSLFDGDLDLALAGYNAGENAVLRHGGIPPYPETRRYVKKVRRYLAMRARADREAAEAASVEKAPESSSPRRLLQAAPTEEPIYHYVDDRGVVHFTNVKPRDAGAEVHVWRPGS